MPRKCTIKVFRVGRYVMSSRNFPKQVNSFSQTSVASETEKKVYHINVINLNVLCMPENSSSGAAFVSDVMSRDFFSFCMTLS